MDYAKFKSQILLPQQLTEYLGVMKLFSCQKKDGLHHLRTKETYRKTQWLKP